MLLEQGALCERDTFQGERCLYNALNDRIRNLLISYDFSKTADPLQPWAAHINSLLTRDVPKTSDITLEAGRAPLSLHKFILSARSPYFAQKLSVMPETARWRPSSKVQPESLGACIRYLYMGEAGASTADDLDEQMAVLEGIDKISRQLEIPRLFDSVMDPGDRRQARQRRSEEIENGRDQFARWFEKNVAEQKKEVAVEKVKDIKWDRKNAIFADVILRAIDEELDPDDGRKSDAVAAAPHLEVDGATGIPSGHLPTPSSRSSSQTRPVAKATLFPAHKAMLLRSEVFATMFSSAFREGQDSEYLHVVPVECSADVLEIILRFLYTEQADFPLHLALDVLHAADMLFIDRLKQRAALLISTLGSGSAVNVKAHSHGVDPDDGDEAPEDDPINIYDVVRAGWDTRVHRLEEFGARYIAYRLERFINEPDFKDLIRESASRISRREETDTVELVDDIRYYLSERFRLRFEDSGLGEMLHEDDASKEKQVAQESGDATQKSSQDVETATVLDADRSHAPDQEESKNPGLEYWEVQQKMMKTLDGDVAGDEFAQDAMKYRLLLGRIDLLMENLGLDG